ncbi:MAG: GNAT family N-acetyltransferase [Candidatus Competibacteraceae bacterium]
MVYDGSKLDGFLVTFCTLSSAKQWVQTDLLSIDGRDISGLLHLRYGYNLAVLLVVADKVVFSKISLGNLFIGMCLENAIENGMTCYDFLKGDEDYKFHWANQGQVSLSIFCHQRP